MPSYNTSPLDVIQRHDQRMERIRRQHERAVRLMRPDPRLDRLLGVDPGLIAATKYGADPAAFRPGSSIPALAAIETMPALVGFKLPTLAAMPAVKGIVDGLDSIRNSPVVKSYRAMTAASRVAQIDRMVGLGRRGETTTSIVLEHVGLTRQANLLRTISAAAEALRYAGVMGVIGGLGSQPSVLRGIQDHTTLARSLQGGIGPAGALDAQARMLRAFRLPLGNLGADPLGRFSASAAAFRSFLNSPEMREWAQELEAEAVEEAVSARWAWLVNASPHEQLALLLGLVNAINRTATQVSDAAYGISDWTFTLVAWGMVVVACMSMRVDG